ncbi:Transcriptional regulatory protein sin3 [Arachnomyces sp. PD_36]|nr:Transcriptional regulatory protein sin3 [Arachnomyces sp. PD_36]
MNPSNGEGWHSSGGGPQQHHAIEQMGQQAPRPLGSYGQNPQQQGPSAQPAGPVLPPPTGQYHPVSQASGHNLPTIADLTQGASASSASHQPPGYGQQSQTSHNAGHNLPVMGQSMQHPSPQSSLNRERERDSRDREIIERQRQQEEMAHREREQREREREQLERQQLERQQLERQQREQQQQQQQQHHPVQSHTGSIPIHQPVASKVPNSIHGPNGLLSNLSASAASNPPQSSLQASNGPANLFATQVQHGDGTPRPFLQHGQGPPPQSMMGFNSSAAPQIPGSVAALAQGQQPILNDALSYLDQVKVRFVEQPDVYNRFLDIMKDFKSQAIDTPGVIQRVSTLFNGHPALIQGFNTFLPPGYRIECGTEDNPDAIRVTTPSGTNTLSMQTRPQGGVEVVTETTGSNTAGPQARPEYYEQPQATWQQQQRQPQQQGALSNSVDSYSPNRLAGSNVYGQPSAQVQGQEYEYQNQQEQQASAANAAAIAHQQEQRGVSQLQNAVSAAATAGAGRGPMMQISPGNGQAAGAAQPMNGLAGLGTGALQASQADLNKRGPVEFNHAISYVNKIKNRFSNAPEIYKQFLEILQTYQRESKPIQDVYGQVTQLFNTAPDLLEDFKQFLPESAAQAKAQAAAARQAMEDATAVSNVRGEPGYSNSGMAQQTPRSDVKMPPLGQFSVKDSAKESKKRRGGPGAQTTGAGVAGQSGVTDSMGVGSAQARAAGLQPGGLHKRTKIHHKQPVQPEAPAVSPTIVPALPEPIPPTHSYTASAEEFAFFDRVKKFIGNKQVFAEFLKLCNLFTTDFIDKNVLVTKAAGYIGANSDIMAWFKRFMSVESADEMIEPKAKADCSHVNLSHCRCLGPSYRLLPRRERQKPCSGRDEMCRSVLNDEWASHPTWASEDSGFVAHKKNQFEDSLHRIEEDRHDYDHNIEACIRTIQLMEPLVQQLSIMTDAERANFKLPPGLGGQSETIYKRVLKKIYEREKGLKVIDDMMARPAIVLPIILYRLKQKAEEWKASQREWDKVWREQMQKGFWRSLDHQAILMKTNDKKQFFPKHVQQEIATKFQEGLELRKCGYQVPKYQFTFSFEDPEVIIDAAHLLISYIDLNPTIFSADPQRVIAFIKDFIPTFFGIDRDGFQTYMDEVYDNTPSEDDDESEMAEDISAIRSRSFANGKKLELLRDVLERHSDKSFSQAKALATEESRAQTPEGRDRPLVQTPPESTEPADIVELKWMEHPGQGNFNQQREYNLNVPYKKETHPFYCNTNVYCFFRTFQILYIRLLHVKQQEKDAHEVVRRAITPKAAHELGMIDKMPSDFLYDTDPKANLYHQIVRMCEETIKGHLDSAHLEETLRRYYMKSGWQLYNLDKMLSGIAKLAGSIFNSDSKDKSVDIVNVFFKEREKEETTHNQEIQYRKQVERFVKDGDLYRVTYNPTTKLCYIQLLTTEDSTLENEELNPEARWSYYVSAYTMRDPTEGVPFSQMRMPFLKRSLPSKLDTDDEYNHYFRPIVNHDGLVIRICANSYHILYEPGTQDWWFRIPTEEDDLVEKGKELAAVRERRKDRFMEKFVNNPKWAQGLSKDQVDESNQRFRSWVRSEGASSSGEKAAVTTATGKAGGEEVQDEQMADAPAQGGS